MDRQNFIAESVRKAIQGNRPLQIKGGDSKAFYGYPAQGDPLDVSAHSGVVEYDPGELVITCRAGSLLSEIRSILRENGQHLPFEPPAFGDQATIGGTVACGFSGPRRPWAGSLRDYLLGVKLLNGLGEVVHYGGQVMKNVAGYDMSRLMAGSLGTLGVLLETSFKVLPVPARERTLQFDCSQAEAIRRVNEWSAQPLPLSGAFWWQEKLRVRLSGTESETERAARRLGADRDLEADGSWQELREHQTAFFTGSETLWRLSLPPATAPLDLAGECLVDWGGAQRWYRNSMAEDEIRERAALAGGHATLFRGSGEVRRFHPLPDALNNMQKKIKQALDPNAIFNPHRMSPDW
ncbi:MAG: glycolate oxidase subunit GlcE [Xanthomonadales bacterium]|nr:glycolate oxidase subunit GlcE [Gammaproteobacteria bacterium]MBT8055239.1 glycolate oxidase subunit GlcE [Gammaproteobacteria bacterium]NND57027.1 glycolate oxidase subunit GlcE [Xanthomonadales bacterium]NNK51896.1 glycolate oxidase subunit GlcE [Xanthomonadales bacterium]